MEWGQRASHRRPASFSPCCEASTCSILGTAGAHSLCQVPPPGDEVASRWRERQRHTPRVLHTRPHTHHATLRDTLTRTARPSAPGPEPLQQRPQQPRTPLPPITPRHGQTVFRALNEGPFTGQRLRLRHLHPHLQLPCPRGYQRSEQGRPGLHRLRRRRGPPSGPPRSTTPLPVLGPYHALMHGSPVPSPAESPPGSFLSRPSPQSPGTRPCCCSSGDVAAPEAGSGEA